MILEAARRRAAELKPQRDRLERRARAAPAPPPLRAALRRETVAVIAEIKRRSPSAGRINADLSARDRARAYAAGGAAAISVLTDEPFFGGKLTDLREAARAVRIPLLRKDFIVSEEQLLEARAAGASAALLIVRALEPSELARLLAMGRDVGLETLVEAHTADEISRALDAGAEIVGVNSRDLDSFEVDLERGLAMLAAIPPAVVAVAESGIASGMDVRRAAGAGADAVLVGTALSQLADPGPLLQDLSTVERHGR